MGSVVRQQVDIGNRRRRGSHRRGGRGAGGAEGTVTAQHPIAGERWFRYQDFVLTYANDSGAHTIGGPDPEG